MERNRRTEGQDSTQLNLLSETREPNSYADDVAEADRVQVENKDLYNFRTDELPEKSTKKKDQEEEEELRETVARVSSHVESVSNALEKVQRGLKENLEVLERHLSTQPKNLIGIGKDI